MADTEEPRFNTLAERIAALNQQKNFQSNPSVPSTAGKRPPPPPPPGRSLTEGPPAKSPSLPPRPVRSSTDKLPPPLPRRTTGQEDGDSTTASSPGARPGPPPLPTRNPESTTPKLPTRRPSTQTLSVRRNSNASDVSQLSTISSLSLSQTKSAASNGTPEGQVPRRLPPTLEQAKLPPLPPTRRELEAKAIEAAAAGDSPSLPPRRIADPPQPSSRPSLPPRLPSRPGSNAAQPAVPEEPSPALPTRRLPPPANINRARSALESGFGAGKSRTIAPPEAPPPIPLSSRPTIAQIDAATSRGASAAAVQKSQSCLACRDFSGPDTLAAQHPTASLPRGADPIPYLAQVLCASFSSPTDKARAIFTWMHHNVVYDVHGLFNNCIPRGQTPAETIFSGKAVCEGYARVYEAIATRAGLQCVVVTGHGKGFGFNAVRKGQRPPPPDPTGHAWNSVRIDAGEWKLIDACWGAGALCDGAYSQRFEPECFTMSNERFGTRHFPADSHHWYRQDGRALSWEEYILSPAGDEPAQWTGDATREGLDEGNFAPMQLRISVHGGDPVVRFQFGKVCEHWTSEKNGEGKPMLLALKIGGPDGRKEDLVPLETDGKFWQYLDVNAHDLGAPGQHVALIAFQTVDGQDARGMTKEEWLRKKGRCGFSYAYLIRWELV